MKKSFKQITKVVASVIVLSFAFTGCQSKGGTYPSKKVDFIAPGGAGGGWDTAIRTVAQTLQTTKLITVPMPVTNHAGGGGAVALADLQKKAGDDHTIVVYSPPLLLINLNGTSEYSYNDLTPISRLITDYGCFVVSKNSKYKTINEIFDALKADPKSVKFGGNSAAGSMDHIQFIVAAQAAGIEDISQLDYISFQNNEGAAQLLGGHIDLLSTGLADVAGLVESGDLLALASTADERVGTGVLAEIPTLKEQGIDSVFYNWRGLFGPKDMPADVLKFWEDTLAKMVETKEWDEACTKNGWTKSYANSADFKTFLDQTNEEYKEVLEDLGMLAK
ncbi:Bug family tripartite tricarboxylate transporter substrate binding protein [Cellulosilyticum sp. I15G10I2]|uniref:Bug family tripartite tricarboxylate transporter substrate binding protein n=1 Tax=Cellulosilyticum sp. I15G10I2 TaxID=1892843 RepID=UPI00085C7F42|nr:tripartite tricarboxylate transporter substrate binding protein [Cellulosilyticum sp. I15G10I2]